MEKFVPYEKLSKKEKRKLDGARRTIWEMSPVTRKPANPKAYNRKKTHREFHEETANGASFLLFAQGTEPGGNSRSLYPTVLFDKMLRPRSVRERSFVLRVIFSGTPPAWLSAC